MYCNLYLINIVLLIDSKNTVRAEMWAHDDI